MIDYLFLNSLTPGRKTHAFFIAPVKKQFDMLTGTRIIWRRINTTLILRIAIQSKPLEMMKMNEIGKSAEEALAYVKTIPPAQGKTMMNVPFEKRDLVRFGFIGMGSRGSGQLNEVLAVEGARGTAISDPVEEQMLKAKEKVEQAGQPVVAVPRFHARKLASDRIGAAGLNGDRVWVYESLGVWEQRIASTSSYSHTPIRPYSHTLHSVEY